MAPPSSATSAPTAATGQPSAAAAGRPDRGRDDEGVPALAFTGTLREGATERGVEPLAAAPSSPASPASRAGGTMVRKSSGASGAGGRSRKTPATVSSTSREPTEARSRVARSCSRGASRGVVGQRPQTLPVSARHGGPRPQAERSRSELAVSTMARSARRTLCLARSRTASSRSRSSRSRAPRSSDGADIKMAGSKVRLRGHRARSGCL